MMKRKPEPAADYVFDMMQPNIWRDGIKRRRVLKEELGRDSFYLLFQYYGGENIGKVTSKAHAVKRARERAAEHPEAQYVVMRAEVIVRAKLTVPKIEEIEL